VRQELSSCTGVPLIVVLPVNDESAGASKLRMHTSAGPAVLLQSDPLLSALPSAITNTRSRTMLDLQWVRALRCARVGSSDGP